MFPFCSIFGVSGRDDRERADRRIGIMNRTALIIGATGGIGGETARALLAHGWTVRALARDPEAAARTSGWIGDVTWLRGDAMNPADVIAAAAGAEVIVHAANPLAYRNWSGLALPM